MLMDSTSSNLYCEVRLTAKLAYQGHVFFFLFSSCLTCWCTTLVYTTDTTSFCYPTCVLRSRSSNIVLFEIRKRQEKKGPYDLRCICIQCRRRMFVFSLSYLHFVFLFAHVSLQLLPPSPNFTTFDSSIPCLFISFFFVLERFASPSSCQKKNPKKVQYIFIHATLPISFVEDLKSPSSSRRIW